MSKFLITSDCDTLAECDTYPSHELIQNIKDTNFGSDNIGLTILTINNNEVVNVEEWV